MRSLIKYLTSREERMKRIRVKRRTPPSGRPRIPSCLRRIECSVLRKQMIGEYIGSMARGEQVQANNLTQEFLRNKDHHVETWREREDHKVGEIPTTGAYTLNKSLPSNLSFTEERDSKIRSH